MRRTNRTLRGKKRMRGFRLPACESPVVSVVVPVKNERKTIARVLRQLSRLHRQIEVIVVANGSRDGTPERAKRLGAKVIAYDAALGHDVGRAVGAKAAKGEVILFTDGDIVIPASEFRPLIKAVLQGEADIALNTYSGPVHRANVHSVVLAKHALNGFLSKPELRGASMTTIPHAISRKALQAIGAQQLAVPPLAHAIACQKGLSVKGVHHIPVGKKNPRRRRRGPGGDPLASLIVGDHLEAIAWLVRATNERGSKTDLTRIRSIVR